MSESLRVDDQESALEDRSINYIEDESVLEEGDYPIDQYDLAATPNDFNVSTIFSFMESGAVTIPGFQRNFVWDIRRASKLIESLIIGLPVPQLFLYEEGRNKFQVIDGQQRIMSIYYFVKQRFPHKEKRTAIRRIFEEHGGMPNNTLHDDEYFTNFNLSLPEKLPKQRNKFNRLNYSTLGDYKTAFDLRPVRIIIVKQLHPDGDDTAVYEIFNRLNSGGLNLTPQEIRISLYHSPFFSLLSKLNSNPDWRQLIGLTEPELHMKDIEVLLRGFAMLIKGSDYNPSMIKFLNSFAKECKRLDDTELAYFAALFDSFLAACQSLSKGAYLTKRNKFSVTIFESVFAAAAKKAFAQRTTIKGRIDPKSVEELKSDEAFSAAAEKGTAQKANVDKRLMRASELIRLI